MPCEAVGLHHPSVPAAGARTRGALADEGRSVFEGVSRAPVLGSFDLRARPGQKARTARIKPRSMTVTLRGPYRPGGRPEPIEVNVVEAREVGAPRGVKPVHWVLLTTWLCGTYAEAVRVVKAYSRRWLIEEYHKVLKTGAGVEKSELVDPEEIEPEALEFLDAKFGRPRAGGRT